MGIGVIDLCLGIILLGCACCSLLFYMVVCCLLFWFGFAFAVCFTLVGALLPVCLLGCRRGLLVICSKGLLGW